MSYSRNHLCILFAAGVVLVNASTMFCDGESLGMGAEIGISTDKLHARGPMGLQELTSYKHVIHGRGHIMGDARLAPHDGHRPRPLQELSQALDSSCYLQLKTIRSFWK